MNFCNKLVVVDLTAVKCVNVEIQISIDGGEWSWNPDRLRAQATRRAGMPLNHAISK